MYIIFGVLLINSWFKTTDVMNTSKGNIKSKNKNMAEEQVKDNEYQRVKSVITDLEVGATRIVEVKSSGTFRKYLQQMSKEKKFGTKLVKNQMFVTRLV